MCGIAGAIWTDPRLALEEKTLRAMTDVIRHRGPDDDGLFMSPWKHDATGTIHPGVGLGFRRLSIIDLAGGHQPLSNEDGSIQIIFNGEIYNYRELRRGLEGTGHQFRTESDTETIVHLYEDWGVECFERLNGMFAIAIWDARKNQLVLARDRLGKKPLYYAHQAGRLSFASELKSLRQIDSLTRTIDPGAIDLFLTYQYVPHPYSIYQEVSKLPPGHFAVYRNDQMHVEKFWKVDWNREQPKSIHDACDEIRARLTDAVRIRLRSDVPLGAFLSGGIDSSLIAAIAQKELRQPLKTFAIGFTERDFDETQFAQMVAEKIGSQHERFEVAPDALAILDPLVAQYDEPFGDSSAIPTWYLSELTRKHVTVALSGDGGDELFAGYDRYRALWMSEMTRHWLPLSEVLKSSWIQKLPASQGRRSLVRRIQRYSQALGQPPVRRYMNWIQIFSEASRIELYRDDFVESLPNRDPVAFLESAWATMPNRDLVSKASLGDLQTYLPCDLMTKVDIASMAHSLEVRQPFLDFRLVEWAASLNIQRKFGWRQGKLILRHAFRGLIPDRIWNRPKMGFGVPIAKWMRGPLRAKVEQLLLSSESECHRYLRKEALQAMVERHMAGTVNEGYRLWNLIVLETWLRHETRGKA